MKVFVIATLAALASALSIDRTKRDSPFEVKLKMTGNTAVKATITNKGAEGLKIFKTGSILDTSAVEKVEVFQNGQAVPFAGIRQRLSISNLDEGAFQVIAAGETIEASFDIAALHDLSSGGDVEVLSEGGFAYAEVNSTAISGAVPFSSNIISTSVNGVEASKARRDFYEKRTVLQSDCTGTRRTTMTTAISNCRSLAANAASIANTDNAKLTEYFKSTSSSARSTVVTTFNRVASQCGSTTSGDSRYYCSDILSACSNGVLAYTYPSTSQMVSCNLFFTGLPALSRTCHAQDQATTILHEMTHLSQVKGTSDYGGYGYNFVRSLTSAQNLNHADTYTLFAQSIYAGC